MEEAEHTSNVRIAHHILLLLWLLPLIFWTIGQLTEP